MHTKCKQVHDVYIIFDSVEDQVMVTEFKGEDTDPPVNAVTGIAEDHDKQSYEDQDSDPPTIQTSD